ncbi:MAG: hypothetical protein ACKOU6_10205, partial [Planctomycetota bacterium]
MSDFTGFPTIPAAFHQKTTRKHLRSRASGSAWKFYLPVSINLQLPPRSCLILKYSDALDDALPPAEIGCRWTGPRLRGEILPDNSRALG